MEVRVPSLVRTFALAGDAGKVRGARLVLSLGAAAAVTTLRAAGLIAR